MQRNTRKYTVINDDNRIVNINDNNINDDNIDNGNKNVINELLNLEYKNIELFLWFTGLSLPKQFNYITIFEYGDYRFEIPIFSSWYLFPILIWVYLTRLLFLSLLLFNAYIVLYKIKVIYVF